MTATLKMLMPATRAMFPAARALGPYLLVELLLPGGTLVALLLWLYRHWRAADSDWGLGPGDWGFETRDVELGLASDA